MSRDERLLIYPFNIEILPLLRSQKFKEQYKNVILCSLKGSGFNGKDASEADGGEVVGISINENFDQCFEECSVVLFIKSQYINITDNEIDELIAIAKEKGKKVINKREQKVIRNKEYMCESLEEADTIFGNVKINITNEVSYEFSYGDLLKCEGLVDVTTPVIAVAGTGKNTNKLAIQISVLEELECIGYKVSWIGSNSLCELIGGNNFPQFMFEDETTDTEKVLLFNRYLKNLEVNEKPDVIIIGIPGGIMPCSKNIIGDFGILSYKVFQSITPDYLLLSVFYDDYRSNFIDEIKMHVKYKFGCNLNMINICNRRIDWEEVRVLNQNVIPFYLIGNESVNELIQNMSEKTEIKIANIMRNHERKLIVKDIIDKLEDDEPNIIF